MKMRIAICHHFSLSFFAGGEKFVLYLAKMLKERGHDVSIHSISVARKRRRNVKDVLEVPYTERWVQKIDDVDVVYYVYAPLLHQLLRTDAPKIAGLHSPMYAIDLQHDDVKRINLLTSIRYFGLLRTAARLYFSHMQRELRTYNAVHVVNPLMKNLVKHPKVVYVPIGIDVGKYRLVDPSEKPKKFTVLFVGRREWAKGFDLYVAAAKLLSNYDIRFVATGEGNVANVQGLGFVPEERLPEIYAEAHAVVYPSRIDTVGLTILEALASGVPVITTPLPAHTAFNLPLIYASTPEEIAEKILGVKNMYERNAEKYRELSIRGRKAAEEYDLRKVIRLYEDMIVEVLKDAKG